MAAPKAKIHSLSSHTLTQEERRSPGFVVLGSDQDQRGKIIARASKLMGNAQNAIRKQKPTSYTEALLIARFSANLLAALDPNSTTLVAQAANLQERQRPDWKNASPDLQIAGEVSALVEQISDRIKQIRQG